MWRKSRGRRNCYYCQGSLDWDGPPSDLSPTREHRQPKSKGGAKGGANNVLACHGCNNEKGNMTEAQFYEYREVTKGVKHRTGRMLRWKKHLGQKRIADPYKTLEKYRLFD